MKLRRNSSTLTICKVRFFMLSKHAKCVSNKSEGQSVIKPMHKDSSLIQREKTDMQTYSNNNDSHI